MFWRKKTDPAHVKPKLRDVWIAARLAQVHSASTHSVLSTMVTELGQIRTAVEQLREHAIPVVKGDPPFELPTPIDPQRAKPAPMPERR